MSPGELVYTHEWCSTCNGWQQFEREYLGKCRGVRASWSLMRCCECRERYKWAP